MREHQSVCIVDANDVGREDEMIVFKFILLVLLFFIGNSMVGMLLQALWKRDSVNKGVAWDLLSGTGFLFALFTGLAFVVIDKGAGFPTLRKLFFLGYFGVMACSFVLLFVVKNFRNLLLDRVCQIKSREYWKECGVFVVLFFIIGATFFMHRPYLEDRFDLPERMSTLEAVGTFGGVNPLTGEGMAMPSPWKQWSKGVMPAWYLFFAGLLDLSTYQMLFWVVPLWTLSLCMSAYYVIAQILFDNQKKRIGWFMVFFALFTLCGNRAYMNPSYGLLHYGYEESTLLSNVVLPCVFAFFLFLLKKGTFEKKR